MANESKGASTGVVVTPSTTVMVHVRVRGGLVDVTSWDAIPTPSGAMDGGAIADPLRMSAALKSLRRDLNIRDRATCVALFAPAYGMRAIRLPDVPEKERRTLVRGELEDAAALPVGAGGFDFLWIPISTEDGKRQADISAYYVGDQTVDTYVDTTRSAGMELDGIEPASLAMMRAYIATNPARKALALLCPGEKHTDLCVQDGDGIRLMRRIPAGWQDLAQAEAEEAASMRLLGGDEVEDDRPLPEPGVANATGIWSDEGDYPDVTSDPHERTLAARPAPPPAYSPAPETSAPLERTSSSAFLASEVTRTLAFYARENPDAARPEAVVVLGPTFVIRSCRKALTMALPVQLSTTDQIAGLALPPPATSGIGAGTLSESPELILAAVGAALGALGHSAGIPAVDISQQESIARTRRRAPMVLLAGMAGSTLWMLGAAAAAITLTFLESSAASENSRLKADITKVKEERAALLKAAEVGNAAQDAYTKSVIPVGAVLGRVAGSTTPGVSLTGLKVGTDGTVEINGDALNVASMQAFMVMLAQGSTVRGLRFDSITQDAAGHITFKIVGTYRDKK